MASPATGLIVNRAFHRVYLFVLAASILGQTLVTYIAYDNVRFWLRIAHAFQQRLWMDVVIGFGKIHE